MSIKPIQVFWFTQVMKTFGIVIARDTVTNEIKVYIGSGSGVFEESDILRILEYGTKVSPQFFKDITAFIDEANKTPLPDVENLGITPTPDEIGEKDAC